MITLWKCLESAAMKLRCYLEEHFGKAIVVCVLISIGSAAICDLVSHESYIRTLALLVVAFAISSYTNVIDIANTPLAQLTIAKILALIGQCFELAVIAGFSLFLLRSAWNLLSWILDKLDTPQRIPSTIEDVPLEPDENCLKCVSDMQETTDVNELAILLFYAVGEWPQWERQLQSVYEERLRQLSKT